MKTVQNLGEYYTFEVPVGSPLAKYLTTANVSYADKNTPSKAYALWTSKIKTLVTTGTCTPKVMRCFRASEYCMRYCDWKVLKQLGLPQPLNPL